MVKSISELREGDVLNGIMYRRVMENNKNFIQITVGATGSGKSLTNLRQAELWYKNILKREFPIENVCFSPEAILERLSTNSLKRGDILIFEEAGTSQGSLDFQSSMAKIFNYVLQAFRSMNIILFINLPYLSMLNKNTRMLAHFLIDTIGVDKNTNQCRIKPFHLQVNQETGKVYKHYPKIMIDGCYEQIELLGYTLASEELRNKYEEKKSNFLRGLISGGLESMQNKDKKRLTPFQCQMKGCLDRGIWRTGEVAKELGCSQRRISENLGFMEKKGYNIEEMRVNAKKSE